MSIVHGIIKKIDKTTKAIVVKTADETEHTIKVTEQVTVHGTKESFDDLKEVGSRYPIPGKRSRKNLLMNSGRSARMG